MKKKLVVVGKGTAGAQSMAHFMNHMPECEFEWHFDPSVPVQSVGEGSTLNFSATMFRNLGFTHYDLKHVDGTIKTGILKQGWGKEGKEFFHDFPPPGVGWHFNACKLQDYIFDKLKDKAKIVEGHADSNNIDADFIVDCSGKPSDLSKFNIPQYIPVNAVHVTQCFWDMPRFDYTLTIARPHGWVFGIPLQNRCAIGYMYNKDMSTLDEVKDDVQYMFDKYNLTPSETTNTFTFNNYTRKQNFTDRVAYNGNASFFLEPLEATSLGTMHMINTVAQHIWGKVVSTAQADELYARTLTQTERFIMMHYYAGSPFQSKFWDFAQERGERCMQEAKSDEFFKQMILVQKNATSLVDFIKGKVPEYGQWWPGSFYQNIHGLGIQDDLDKIFLP